MTPTMAALVDTMKEHIGPAFDAFGNTAGEGRRIFARGQHAAGDAAATAVAHVRQHPLRAIVAAAGAGAIAGAVIGVAAGLFFGRARR